MILLQISNAIDYLPVVLQLIFAILFTGIPLVFLMKKSRERNTLTDSAEQMASGEMDGFGLPSGGNLFFFMPAVAILFFVALIWLYPAAVNFRELGWKAFLPMLLFSVMMGCGYIYIIKTAGRYEKNK